MYVPIDRIFQPFTMMINDMDVGLRFSLLKLKSFSSQVEQDIMALFRHMSMLKSLRTQECFKYEKERQKIEHHGQTTVSH
jgi:hypothetical protein